MLFAVLMKLVVLPGLGYTLYRFFEISQRDYMPGIILLASPTATVAYVMAKEIGGDTELAVIGISVSTLMSAVTFFMWLSLVR